MADNASYDNSQGSETFLGATGQGTLANPHIIQRTFPSANLTNPPLYQYADTVGDGTGNINMNVNSSVTNVSFKVTALDGDTGDYMELVIRDNLTALVDQRASVQGRIEIKGA